MRKKIVIGNWKMNFIPSEATTFIHENKAQFDSEKVDVVVCVPDVNIKTVMDELEGTYIKVGAQNMHYMDKGAYTGEISGKMLAGMGVPYVIIGHSERRERFGETDTTVNLKTLKALQHGLIPIICVGESQRQRKEKRTQDILRKQLTFALDELSPTEVAKVIIAYEPIWAIGTGEVATNEQAEEACALIREHIRSRFGQVAADNVRVLYGGSVDHNNAKSLFAMPNIDGGLVGGASLLPSFEQVVHFERN
jgi:triosephosphate isomerase